MRKLNIFKVNGVWQLGRPDQANEKDDEETFTILLQAEMLTQISSGIQNIRESMRSMNTRIDRVDQRIERIEDRINDIERHQRHWSSYHYVIVIVLVPGRMWVGQLGYWAQRVGHVFDPVVLVSPVENN